MQVQTTSSYDFEELLSYLQLFQDSYLSNELVEEDIIESLMQSSLTEVLVQIRRYIHLKPFDSTMTDFVISKYSNIMKLFYFHHSATNQDYSLLFDILDTACKKAPQLISIILSSLSQSIQWRNNQLMQSCMKIVCLLICIKNLKKGENSTEMKQLKEHCLNPKNSRFISVLAYKLIREKEVSKNNIFQFLVERIGEQKQSKKELLMYMQLKGSIISKQITSVAYSSKVDKSNQRSLEQKQREITATIKQELLFPNRALSVEQQLEESIRWLKENENHKRQVRQQTIIGQRERIDLIKQVIIFEFKSKHNFKLIIEQLLGLSFTYVELMKFSIENAIFVLDIEEFIQIMKQILSSINILDAKIILDLKKRVQRELKASCGGEAHYLWRRITSPG